MTGKNVIKAAIDKMTELDAAGWALVLLRCDREADIRRTVEGYVHIARYAPRVKTADWQKKAAEQPILNIKEVTAMGTVKRYGVPFNWQEHAPQGETSASWTMARSPRCWSSWCGARTLQPRWSTG